RGANRVELVPIKTSRAKKRYTNSGKLAAALIGMPQKIVLCAFQLIKSQKSEFGSRRLPLAINNEV
uniref:Uncharacterized protein n=1 Tax=Romanomermis culicivorax TaxID=13658 RepID=A0A915HM47_ROMCU